MVGSHAGTLYHGFSDSFSCSLLSLRLRNGMRTVIVESLPLKIERHSFENRDRREMGKSGLTVREVICCYCPSEEDAIVAEKSR